MKNILIFSLMIIILMQIVHGYGLASDYLADNTMYLAPGESREFRVELQNAEAKLKFSFELESDIAAVKDPEEFYYVGGNKTKQNVILLIEMPKNAVPGDEYSVKYSAYPLTEQGKPINLNIVLSNRFTVKVKEPPEEEKKDFNAFWFILIIGLLGFVITLIFNKNKLMTRRFSR